MKKTKMIMIKKEWRRRENMIWKGKKKNVKEEEEEAKKKSHCTYIHQNELIKNEQNKYNG